MPASIFIPPEVQYIDGNGNPIVGGHVYTYETDMSTPKVSYVDYNETAQNPNPVILDASGRAAIWLDGVYGIRVTDANDVPICTANNVFSYTNFDLSGLTASIADLNSTTTSGILTAVNYTIQLVDRGKTVLVDATSADVSITLPSISSVINGYKVCVKKVDFSVNKVKLLTNSGEQVDGVSNPFLYDYGDFVEILSDGNQWRIVASQARGAFVNITDNTTIDLSYNGRTVFCDVSTNSINITLPSIAAVGDGFTVAFKTGAINSNIVTITPSSPATIDGEANLTMNSGYEEYILKANGTQNNWYIIGSYLSNAWTTGDTKTSYQVSQPGWILTGTDTWTIGNPTSGAHYANNACHDLYIFLYNTLSDAICPVNGGRTANAENDWNAASKYMTLPKCGGRVVGAVGQGAGLTARTLAANVGEETHQLSIGEMAWHDHTTGIQLVNGGTQITVLGGGAGPNHVSGAGENGLHNNMQPTTFLYLFIKL